MLFRSYQRMRISLRTVNSCRDSAVICSSCMEMKQRRMRCRLSCIEEGKGKYSTLEGGDNRGNSEGTEIAEGDAVAGLPDGGSCCDGCSCELTVVVVVAAAAVVVDVVWLLI